MARPFIFAKAGAFGLVLHRDERSVNSADLGSAAASAFVRAHLSGKPHIARTLCCALPEFPKVHLGRRGLALGTYSDRRLTDISVQLVAEVSTRCLCVAPLKH